MIIANNLKKMVMMLGLGFMALAVCSCNSNTESKTNQAASTQEPTETVPADQDEFDKLVEGQETEKKPNTKTPKTDHTMSKLEHLTAQTFKEKVFNYEANKEWAFEGDKPCIIDFYADWCQPCKMIAPILEELQEEYEGEINIYKVNTEEEPELAGAFGIRSIPSLLFCPTEGEPQMAQGALPKQTFKQAINEVLLKKAESTK